MAEEKTQKDLDKEEDRRALLRIIPNHKLYSTVDKLFSYLKDYHEGIKTMADIIIDRGEVDIECYNPARDFQISKAVAVAGIREKKLLYLSMQVCIGVREVDIEDQEKQE